MRTVLGLLVVALLVLGFYYFYFSKSSPGGEGTLAVQAINITGVKNDLNAIAQAERMYFAEKGAYASWDELVSSGTLKMQKPGREGYTYTIEVTDGGFTATARYPGAPGLHWPTLVIDQTMEIRESQ